MKRLNYFLEKLILPIRIVTFRNKIKKIKKKNKKLFKPINKNIEKKHKKLWKPLCKNINLNWLRFYSNVSGINDYKYVPEDIFYSIIERKLNDVNYSSEIANKSNYNQFKNNYFPVNYLENVSGTYLVNGKKIITKKDAIIKFKSIKENIIIKPSIESGGGENILFLNYNKEKFIDNKNNEWNLDLIEKLYRKDFLIQKIIKQNKLFSQFNKSINTLRIFTYRSVLDEKLIILKVVLRMGRKGMLVDNQRAGGISIGIDKNFGIFNDFAVDKYGNKFYSHPESCIKFKRKTVMNIEEIKKVVKELARQIPSQRLLSFDVCIDENEDIKVIEINTLGVEINFLQIPGESLFGEYTKEIIDYCQNQKSDEFQYFRGTK